MLYAACKSDHVFSMKNENVVEKALFLKLIHSLSILWTTKYLNKQHLFLRKMALLSLILKHLKGGTIVIEKINGRNIRCPSSLWNSIISSGRLTLLLLNHGLDVPAIIIYYFFTIIFTGIHRKRRICLHDRRLDVGLSTLLQNPLQEANNWGAFGPSAQLLKYAVFSP